MVHLHCPEKSLYRDSTLCEHSIFSREKQEAQGSAEHRFWDKLKLSNTYFTSPQTIKSLDIVYEFGYGEFSPSNISAIVVAAKNKQLAFAIPDSNSAGEKAAFKIADLQSVRDSFGLKNYDELLSCMQKNKISIVSFSPQLLEQPSVEILGDVREFGTSRQR